MTTKPTHPATLSPGQHLRLELERRGWTQKELAQRCGCSPGVVTRILSNRSPVSPNMDWKLSLALGTPQGHWLRINNNWIAHLRGWNRITTATAQEDVNV